MVLDHDCVRDILLAVEQCPFNQSLNLEKLEKLLPDYGSETIWYACLKLGEGSFLDIETGNAMMSILPGIKQIKCLTYRGHEFLGSIRDEKRWSKVKTAGHAIRDYSLAAIGEIAEGMTSAAISAYFAGK